MGKRIKITSVSNDKVKQAIRLKDRRQRKKTDLFLIEGYRELSYSLLKKSLLQSLFICPEYFFKNPNEYALIDAIAQQVEVYECTKIVFDKLSYRDRPDGLLAVAKQYHKNARDLRSYLENKKNCVILICESIEKPGNLGTILRSCDATGVDAIVICDACTDVFNPNVVRASIGTLFTQTIFDEISTHEAFDILRQYRIEIVASSPDAKKVYTNCDYKNKCAIIVGAEQYGLSDEWIKQADHLVKIPMKGKADSLNVASATTLLLYEAFRQRSK